MNASTMLSCHPPEECETVTREICTQVAMPRAEFAVLSHNVFAEIQDMEQRQKLQRTFIDLSGKTVVVGIVDVKYSTIIRDDLARLE